MTSHPGRDVVVKAVDKVHQFDPQQTHPVNLLIYRLFDLQVLGQSSLQFLSYIREVYKKQKHSSHIRNVMSLLCFKISKSHHNSYH